MKKTKPKTKKRKLNKRAFLLVGALLGIFVAIICIGGYALFGRYYYRLDRDLSIVRQARVQN